MIYISHLDLQKLLQRAFRRADVELSYSQGYNPHPKMSYGKCISIKRNESYGEYVDIEIEEEISVEEFLMRLNKELPEGIEFIKAEEIEPGTPSLASTIEYGEYLFNIRTENHLSKEFVKSRIADFMNKEEIMITKKNKKGKIVESNIRPMIKFFDLLSLDENNLTLIGTIATGSKVI